MDREAFEQLVSDWLDRPEHDELCRAVAAAAAESSELERLKDEWVRLDRLVRSASSAVDQVDWPRFRERIDQALDSDREELDEKLRGLTDVQQRVDWPRLRERISRAVGDAHDRPRVIRFPLRRVAAGLALISAAAVLVLMFTLPLRPPRTSVGVAQVRVNMPAEAWRARGQRPGYTHVSVSAPPDSEEADAAAQPSRSDSADPRLAEVFLMVEPAHLTTRTRGGLTPFAFN